MLTPETLRRALQLTDELNAVLNPEGMQVEYRELEAKTETNGVSSEDVPFQQAAARKYWDTIEEIAKKRHCSKTEARKIYKESLAK